MAERIGEAQLAGILHDIGRRHHQAFLESDGADPEWAMWYATELQSQVWDRFGRLPSRGELVYLLVGAERALRTAHNSKDDWPVEYARFILAHLAGSDRAAE